MQQHSAFADLESGLTLLENGSAAIFGRGKKGGGGGGAGDSKGKKKVEEEYEDDDYEEEEEEEPIEIDDLAKRTLNYIKGRRASTLAETIAAVSSSTGAKPEEVAKRIYTLREAKLVSITDEDPPRSFASYLGSSYSLWFWAMIALVSTTVAVVYYSPGPLAYVRYALGALFVLYLPGSALIELLYPKKTDLSQLERVALSIGLSLALVPLTGLVLNYTPWGIRLDPIVVSLSLLTVGLSVGAAVRKLGYLKLSAPQAVAAKGGTPSRVSGAARGAMAFHSLLTGLRRWGDWMAAPDRIERRANRTEPHPPYPTMPLHYEA